MMNWLKQYPWIVLIVMLGFFIVWAMQSQTERIDRRVTMMETARHTDSIAEELAITTAHRDSVSRFGDSLRLYNQMVIIENQKVIMAKQDTILEQLENR
jgi:hypothetical protein